MKPLRITFFGSPKPAKEILESLFDSNHTVVSVVTQPDKRRGRGSALVSTPVKSLSVDKGIPVLEPKNKAELIEQVLSVKADVGVVVAYGRILPKAVLDHFPMGCINVHYSILPKWRGAAPVERAILNGDKVTGVSIMQMEEGLDTGPIFAFREVDIDDSSTTTSMFVSLNAVAADLLKVVLDDIEKQIPTEQSGEASYAAKLDTQDFYFDSSSTKEEINRKARAGSTYKGAWTSVNGEKFNLIEAVIVDGENAVDLKTGQFSRDGLLATSNGYLQLVTVQTPGKHKMSFRDWANGIDKTSFPLKIAD